MLRLVVLAVIAACAAPGAASGDAPKTVRPSAQWSGELADPDLKKAAPASGAVTTQAAFEALWAAWRGKEKVPAIDFKTDFVVVALLAPGGGVRILEGTKGLVVLGLDIDAEGDAGLKMGPVLPVTGPRDPPGPKWVPTKGAYYGLGVFPRAGVKKLHGKDLPPPER